VLAASLSLSTQGEERVGGGLRLRRPLSGVLEEGSSLRILQLGFDTGLQAGVVLATSLSFLSTQGGERESGGLSSMEGEKQASGLRRPLSGILEEGFSSRTLQLGFGFMVSQHSSRGGSGRRSAASPTSEQRLGRGF
jgi:hypothetical protein